MTPSEPDRDPEHERAEALDKLHTGDVQGAVRALEALVQRCPDAFRAWMTLGGILFDPLEDFERAARAFRAASALEPEDQLASVGLFHSLQNIGMTEEAVAEAVRFLRLHEHGVALHEDHKQTFEDFVEDPQGMMDTLIAEGMAKRRKPG